ncbi:MAG: DNA repair protein RadA, partial [Acutalibacteraceae bacterium]
MAQKIKTMFVCQECGYENPKWHGKCPSCGEWDCLTEEVRVHETQASKRNASTGNSISNAQNLHNIIAGSECRYKTGLSEFDRVLGGGIVKGSLVLLSGDPGIGKSTILLQVCEKLGENLQVLYVSGEESAHQIKLRADRLNVSTPNLFIMCETNVEYIVDYVRNQKPDAVIIDSIQTMNIAEISSSSGSITQVRESTNLLMRVAKELDIPIIIVGHVNKDGNIAGPKVLEHIVDAVLYFEGERHLSYRILRAIKNRYGSTNEIGVFEMLDKGLSQVMNPSLML